MAIIVKRHGTVIEVSTEDELRSVLNVLDEKEKQIPLPTVVEPEIRKPKMVQMPAMKDLIALYESLTGELSRGILKILVTSIDKPVSDEELRGKLGLTDGTRGNFRL